MDDAIQLISQSTDDVSTFALYGYCPHCGSIGLTRERRPDGNDSCYALHVYPTSQALNSAQVKPLRSWLRQRKIAW